MVSMALQDSIEDVIKVSIKIMTIKLAVQKREFLLVQVYAPDSSYPDEEYENFCQQIQMLLTTTKYPTEVIIMGDLNARIGKESKARSAVCVKFAYECQNERGQYLLDFCEMNGLVIPSTFYK